MSLHFATASVGYADTIEAWLDGPDVRRWLGGIVPVARYLTACASSPMLSAWIARAGIEPVGLVSIEVDQDLNCIWPAILISAQHRKRGYGRECLRFLRAQFPGKALRAEIEVDNSASIALAVSFGFERTIEPATEGFVGFILLP